MSVISMPDKNAYLKAMGIDVWIERHSSVERPLAETEVVSSNEVSTPVLIAVTASNEPETAEITKVEILDWQALQTRVAECQLCELSKTRTQTIFGAGDQSASLMIIGDAPNAEDEQQGGVFSGKAGELLTAMLKAMGYQRKDVYISSVLKCKKEESQEPSESQFSSCEPYLLRQIFLVKPKLILALGNSAAQRLLKSKSTMSRLRGQLHYVDGISAPIIISYHPAYLLAAPNEKRKAWEDLQLAMKEIKV